VPVKVDPVAAAPVEDVAEGRVDDEAWVDDEVKPRLAGEFPGRGRRRR
jgi:hypothetical protein